MEKERMEQIIKNCIKEFEYSEYEHEAMLEYMGMTEEEYEYFANKKQNMKTYRIIKTMEDFIPLTEEDVEIWDEISTNDIETAMNDFCEEMGESYMYYIEEMTCSDDYGSEFKFVEVQK